LSSTRCDLARHRRRRLPAMRSCAPLEGSRWEAEESLFVGSKVQEATDVLTIR
jgi:hypothetical protein